MIGLWAPRVRFPPCVPFQIPSLSTLYYPIATKAKTLKINIYI